MSCCGSKSVPAQRHMVSSAGGSPAGVQSVQIAYSGSAVLHVTGPYSGASYVFSSSSAVLTVDARDAMTMLAVPGLRPYSPRR